MDFDLFVSVLVLREISAGDEFNSLKRLTLIKPIPVLTIDYEVEQLAEILLKKCGIPKNAAEDALHIAVAARNNMEYLLTWNCKHIANAVFRKSIDKVLADMGHQPLTICTPEELAGGKSS